MFSVSVRGVAATDEAFVAYGHTRAGRDWVEAVRDRGLARPLQRMLLEPARHHDFVRCVDLGELAATAVSGSVHKVDVDTPWTPDPQVPLPVGRSVVVAASPPPLDFVRGKGREHPLRGSRNFRSGDNPPSATDCHTAR